MSKNRHVIASVEADSIAFEMEMEPGDEILQINGKEIEDIFDYQYLIEDEYIEVLLRKHDSEEEWLLEIEKDQHEDLGVTFENSLMDNYKSCRNKCVFCFIDQMPKGMRETLYFKDDDSRLSFLQGNYVTLTNMDDHDIDRIIRYRMEPINISVQTTNPELRKTMLHNRHAGEIFPKLRRLADAGIEMNGQIVLCKGLNDGEELERSIRDLYSYMPAMRSVSIVPVGLSKYREGLYPLEPFGAEDAGAVIDCIEKWQKKIYEEYGTHFVQASDEWYLLAGRDLPEPERYDGYLQLENGVGMLRLLDEEVREEMEHYAGDDRKRHVTIATGRLAADWMRQMCRIITEKFPNVTADVIPIRNDFFGEMITVSGLITGTDLIAQLKGRNLGDAVLIPCNMLRSGENVFLDDITVEQVILELKTSVEVVDREGKDLCLAVLGEKRSVSHKRRQMYEQTDSSNCGPS